MNKHTLKLNGIRLISTMENIPETPEGIILESLLEGMAEYYSAELSQKVRRGMNETRQKGNFTGGRIPYGYKKDGKKIFIDEDKVKVVLYMYEQYAKNVYVKDIIKSLTEQGIFYNGKVFIINTVHRILNCEKYNGHDKRTLAGIGRKRRRFNRQNFNGTIKNKSLPREKGYHFLHEEGVGKLF